MIKMSTSPNPDVAKLAPLVKAICQLRGFPLPYQLILAQIDQESSGNETIETAGSVPCAENNGTGFMQIEAFYNWKTLGFTTCMDCHNALLVGTYNIDKGIQIMKALYQQQYSNHTVLQAYYRALQEYNTGNPDATVSYANDVLQKYFTLYWNI